jgi:hypothetical protein
MEKNPMRTQVWTRVICVLALGGLLVAFTGCGGSSKKSSSSSSNTSASSTPASSTPSGGGSLADYKTGATKAANDFKNSAQAASTKVKSGTTPQEKLAGLDDLKTSVNTAADDFEKLNPPDNLKSDNAELVKEFRGLASIISDVQTAIKNNDQAKAASVLPRLGTAQSNIAQTIARIQSKIGP